MKKTVFILLVSIAFFAFKTSAQNTTPTENAIAFSIADSADFIGKYKYEGLPFDYMEISVKDSLLYFSGGDYYGPLTASTDKKDVFDAAGQAIFTFIRDADNKVKTLEIEYQGQTFTGNKE